MRRGGASGEPGAREVHRAPEEVHRTDLAEEIRPEHLQDTLGLHELPPEEVGGLGVVTVVLTVLSERDRRIHLVGCAVDASRDTQLVQRSEGAGVELGYGLCDERHRTTATVARADVQPVLEEVEFDVEDGVPVRDRRGAQPSRRDVQRRLPPVVDHRRVSHPDLADDLQPHVEGVAGRGPFRRAQPRPRITGDRFRFVHNASLVEGSGSRERSVPPLPGREAGGPAGRIAL